MHVRETVELAGWIATHRHTIVGNQAGLSGEPLMEYWTASRCRIDRWLRALKLHSLRLRLCPGRESRQLWQLTQPVLEEILTAEILTRVWAALVVATEHPRRQEEGTPLVRSIVHGHLEARARAIRMIVSADGLPVEQAVLLNRLRCRNERWNDLLLSQCCDCGGVDEFVFQRSRLQDYGDLSSPLSTSLTMASLRVAYRRGLSRSAPNGDLNARIAAAVVGCFPVDEFDATGLPRSPWMQRLQRVPHDAPGSFPQLSAKDALPRQAAWRKRF